MYFFMSSWMEIIAFSFGMRVWGFMEDDGGGFPLVMVDLFYMGSIALYTFIYMYNINSILIIYKKNNCSLNIWVLSHFDKLLPFFEL